MHPFTCCKPVIEVRLFNKILPSHREITNWRWSLKKSVANTQASHFLLYQCPPCIEGWLSRWCNRHVHSIEGFCHRINGNVCEVDLLWVLIDDMYLALAMCVQHSQHLCHSRTPQQPNGMNTQTDKQIESYKLWATTALHRYANVCIF